MVRHAQSQRHILGCSRGAILIFVATVIFHIPSSFFYFYICDALRDLLLFVQFKKCEKHPWRSVTFSKVAG